MKFLSFYWDPSPEILPWNIPLINRPILWYGFFFTLGFFLGYLVFQGLLKEFMRSYRIRRKEILKIAERFSVYVLVGAVLGARLGDVFFYQSPRQYVNDPLGIFRFWEGGLSSHGGVVGILIALWVFYVHIKKKYPMLTWVVMLDLAVIPALLAGGFIRLGNFFNQEILGTATNVPWGIIFGRPIDQMTGFARHPVQLYEALFYFAFFFVLLALRKNVPKMYLSGKTVGLFFMITYAFRFCIEFLKMPQSVLLPQGAILNMGQILSIPLILMGILLFFRGQNRPNFRFAKRH